MSDLVIREGHSGDLIREVQSRLKELGFTLDESGTFDERTGDVVAIFLKENGFEPERHLTHDQIHYLLSEGAVESFLGSVDSLDGDAPQMAHMLPLIKAGMESPDGKCRWLAISRGLLKFGDAFVYWLQYMADGLSGEPREIASSLSELASTMMILWLQGTTLSTRADEVERRASLALRTLEYVEDVSTRRLSLSALLILPSGHPLRNEQFIRDNLWECLKASRDEEDWEEFVTVGNTILEHNLEDGEGDSDLARELWSMVEESGSASRAIDPSQRQMTSLLLAERYLREARNTSTVGDGVREHVLGTALKCAEAGFGPGTEEKATLLKAEVLFELGAYHNAAKLVSPLANLDKEGNPKAIRLKSRIRFALGHYERCVELLSETVELESIDYLGAIEENEISETGERFSEDVITLAFSYAYLGNWDDALHSLDFAKSQRLRRSQMLRRLFGGEEFLRLESNVAAAVRGVADLDIGAQCDRNDPIGTGVSDVGKILEEYRRVRPSFETVPNVSVFVKDLGDALEEGEAVVCLGYCQKGLMVAVVLKGDTDSPSEAFTDDQLNTREISEIMRMGRVYSVWDPMTAYYSEFEPMEAIDYLLRKMNDMLGKRLAKILKARGISEVTFVPHLQLHEVPFWALPSLRKFNVRVASSMASFLEWKQETAKLEANLTAVGNPTEDLGLATVESEAVSGLLESRGFQVSLLTGRKATEKAITDSASRNTLLHFAGHGVADTNNPLLSALVVHPDEKWDWPAKGDPFARYREFIPEVDYSASIHRDTPDGRLFIDLNYGEVERLRLEHSSRGTLVGMYLDERLISVAELWTVGDMMAESGLGKCEFAYLAACESGRDSYNDTIDEAVKIPSALQAAGVKSIVCTIWKVEELTALVFGLIFFRNLISCSERVTSLSSLIDACREELRKCTLGRVVDILTNAKTLLKSKVAKAELEHALRLVPDLPDRPFEHPYHWAAFFSLGSDTIELPWGD